MRTVRSLSMAVFVVVLVLVGSACAEGWPDGRGSPSGASSNDNGGESDGGAADGGEVAGHGGAGRRGGDSAGNRTVVDSTAPGKPAGLDLIPDECVEIAMAMATAAKAAVDEALKVSVAHDRSVGEEALSKIPPEIRDDFDVWVAALVDQSLLIAGPVAEGDSSANPLAAPEVAEAQANMATYLDPLCVPVAESVDKSD